MGERGSPSPMAADRVMLGAHRFSASAFARRLVAALLLALPLGAAPVRAQTMVASAEYDELFRRGLREPANLDLSFRFAEAATRIGDYEAAIGALERMLFYNPNLPRVKLELGILYFRLGSYEMARSYFRGALAAPDAPLEIRGRVEGFLAEIERRLSTTQWSVYGQTGLRHQSNANAGPSSSLVRGAGLDVILDRRYVRQPDWNASASRRSGMSTISRTSAGTSGRRASSATPPGSFTSRAWTSVSPRSRPARASRSFPTNGSASRCGPMCSRIRWRSAAALISGRSAAASRSRCRSRTAPCWSRSSKAASGASAIPATTRSPTSRPDVCGRRA